MAKRRKNSSTNGLEVVIELFAALIEIVVYFIIRLLLLIFDFITIYSSGYKTKSQNGFFKTYFDKGKYGEFKLYKQAVQVFGKNNVLTNLYLENVKTEHTELDVVAVTKKGIYVLEMKNYSGYILGSSQDEYWTQVFHKNSKHKFYNPIRQNYAHTKAVESYLNIDSSKINPLIIFGNRAKLTKINVTENNKILELKKFKKYVKQHEKKQLDIFTEEEVIRYIEMLVSKSNMPEEIKQKHIEEVKQLKN